MKPRQTFLFISALTALFLGSCNSKQDLTEDDVYTILNEIIANDSLFIDRVCWKFQDLQLTPEYKKEFTQKDILFIDKQRALFKNLKVKQNKLRYYINWNKTFKFTLVDTACNQGFIKHISVPLISADRKKVIIRITNDCNCMLGSGASTDLYEKKNGHWLRTKTIDGWTSEIQMQKEKLLVTAASQQAGF